MKRLAGIDANFLYSETSTAFMHTLKIAVLDVAGLPPGDLFARFAHVLDARLHLLPGFRQRVLFVPWGLHHPILVDDPEFRLERHLQQRQVPAPGDRQARDAVIAEISASPLPRDRPLWEISLLEGMADGSVVCVTKLHHSLGDGLACARMLQRVVNEQDLPRSESPVSRPAKAVSLPAASQLIRAALRDQGGRARRFLPLLSRTFRALLDRRHLSPSLAFKAPRTLFNRSLPASRSFASTRLPLAGLKALARQLRVTLNSLVLGLVSVALDNFLDTAPAQPLLASVPLGVADERLSGNHVSNLITSLCNDQPDPQARVRAIHRTMQQVRAAHEIVGAGAMRAWAEYTPGLPFSHAMQLYSRWRMADRHRPAVNLIVSNVRGPAEQLIVGGARLTGLTSVGPILDGIGLNITAWSYAGQLSFGLLSHGELPRPLDQLACGLHNALQALRPD